MSALRSATDIVVPAPVTGRSAIPAALRSFLSTWPGRAIAAGLIVAVVAAAVIAQRSTANTPAPTVRTQAVARANVTQTVAVSGSVTVDQARLGFRTQGRLAEILVKVGDTVTAGQALARLDATDLQTAVKQSQANVLSAQAKYDSLVAGASAEDVALAKNALDTATANAQQANKTAQTDLTNAQASLEKAQTAYATAKQTYASLSAGITSDAQTYGSALDALEGKALAIRGTLQDALRPGDVNTAYTAMLSAESSFKTADSYASSILTPALTDYGNALGMVQAAINILDQALSRGTDATYAIGVYQSAQASLTTAGTKLSSALDAVAAQVSAAQASTTQAQNALGTPAAREDPSLDGVRSDIGVLQVAITSEQQLSAGIKSRASQVTSALGPIGDTVSGGLANAEQAVASAQDKVSNTQSAQQIALQNAQLQFQKTTATAKSSDIAVALASLQLAQIALDKANADLGAATLRAPSAGAIAQVANQVGETPSATFIVLALTSKLTLHGTVGEADVAKLKAGQAATVAVDVVGSADRLTGKVGSIDPVATISQGVPVYGVDVVIDLPDPAVRAGMTGTATVILANKQGVLTVPNSAIRTVNGVRTIQVMRDGQVENAQVTFGISNDTLTEVTSGLQEGDLIVLPQPRAAASATPRAGGFGGAGGGPVIIGR